MSQRRWEDLFGQGVPGGLRHDVRGVSLKGAEGVVRYGAMGVVLRDGRPRVNLGRIGVVEREGEEDIVSNEQLERDAARALGVWLIEAAVAAEMEASGRGEDT
jgi:hypothetical protein